MDSIGYEQYRVWTVQGMDSAGYGQYGVWTARGMNSTGYLDQVNRSNLPADLSVDENNIIKS